MKNIKISIIVPTKDRQDKFIRCIRSIVSQDIGVDQFEIIAVNDGSSYDKEQIEILKASANNFTYLEIAASGPARARNMGVNLSHGDILVFTDDDCIAPQDWLKNITAYFMNDSVSRVVAVGGGVKPYANNDNIINSYLSFTQHLDGPIRINGKITNMASADLAVRAASFHKVGRFDERFPYAGAEDQNLIWKLSAIGELDFSESFFVFHDHDIDFAEFKKKYIRYGNGVALHNWISRVISDESDLYVPYCHGKLDLFFKILTICSRSVLYYTRFKTQKKVGLIKAILYRICSLLQEFYFQKGAVEMNEFMRKSEKKFVLEKISS